MKHTLLLIAALWLTGCDVFLWGAPQARTGPTETYPISVAVPGSLPEVIISMGGGSLEVTGGGTALVEGSVQTNVAVWKPRVSFSGSRVTIMQGGANTPISDSTNTVNNWVLRLGKMPMSVQILSGATSGSIDLGGVALRGLRLDQGAASTELKFSSPNTELLREFSVNSGAASIALLGLANANFETLTFNGSASNYTLDFSGKLQRNATANVRSGVSSITLIVPEGTPAKATLSGGLRAANAEGAWQKNGDAYTLSGSGPFLTINVEMGVGALFLKNR